MDIDNLVDKYMAHKGMRRISGHGIDPILPFFMLDIMLSLFNSDIYPHQCKNEMKMIKNKWKSVYHRLNSDFFSVFNEEETYEIIDLMDSFELFINNDLMITKVSVMNVLPSSMSHEHKKILASAEICNMMAQSAQIIWNHIYKDSHGIGIDNSDIAGIEKLSSKWASLFFDKVSKENINLNNSSVICQSVDNLCHKMVSWLQTVK